MVSNPATPSSFRNTIAPWLSVRGSAKAVKFYKSAFGATEAYRMEDPSGSVVAKLSVEGAEFWVGDESPEHGNFSPQSLGGGSVRMILTVADPDSVFARALAARRPRRGRTHDLLEFFAVSRAKADAVHLRYSLRHHLVALRQSMGGACDPRPAGSLPAAGGRRLRGAAFL